MIRIQDILLFSSFDQRRKSLFNSHLTFPPSATTLAPVTSVMSGLMITLRMPILDFMGSVLS